MQKLTVADYKNLIDIVNEHVSKGVNSEYLTHLKQCLVADGRALQEREQTTTNVTEIKKAPKQDEKTTG